MFLEMQFLTLPLQLFRRFGLTDMNNKSFKYPGCPEDTHELYVIIYRQVVVYGIREDFKIHVKLVSKSNQIRQLIMQIKEIYCLSCNIE